MHSKLATVATNWWIEQMKKQCRHQYPQKIIEDNSNFVIIDDSLAEELSRFEKALLEKIHACIENRQYLCLTCCYFPSKELSNIAKKANISATYFPVRAQMTICGNSIEVSTNGGTLRKLTLPAE